MANAIGVRVGTRAADARSRARRTRQWEERIMERFEYASPSTVKEATALLGANWSDAQILAGGTDLISMMKDYRRLAEARRQH